MIYLSVSTRSSFRISLLYIGFDQRWATPTPELELTSELTLFYSELEWSFENIDRVGVEIFNKVWSWSGVGVAYRRSCPSLASMNILAVQI